jgi:hypothetical protein
MFGQGYELKLYNGRVDRYIRTFELFEYVPMSSELSKVRSCHVHKNINFVFTPFKILDRKCVDGDDFNTRS